VQGLHGRRLPPPCRCRACPRADSLHAGRGERFIALRRMRAAAHVRAVGHKPLPRWKHGAAVPAGNFAAEIRKADVSSGSASAGRVRDLRAEKLTSKLSDGIADGRGRQYPTQSGPMRCAIHRPIAALQELKRHGDRLLPDPPSTLVRCDLEASPRSSGRDASQPRTPRAPTRRRREPRMPHLWSLRAGVLAVAGAVVVAHQSPRLSFHSRFAMATRRAVCRRSHWVLP